MKKLRELIDGFYTNDTPENRMAISRKAEIRKGEIASAIKGILADEGLTVREAISILKDTENLIMSSQFGKTTDQKFIYGGSQ